MDGSDTSQQQDSTVDDFLSSSGETLGAGIASGLGAPSGLSNIDLSGAGASFANGALGTLTPYLPYIAIGGAVLLLVMLVKR